MAMPPLLGGGIEKSIAIEYHFALQRDTFVDTIGREIPMSHDATMGSNRLDDGIGDFTLVEGGRTIRRDLPQQSLLSGL